MIQGLLKAIMVEKSISPRCKSFKRLLVGLFPLFLCMLPCSGFCDIRFAQVTDPHLFDPGDENANESVLQWSIDCINSNIQQGVTYNFVVVTGDLGVERVIKRATTNDFLQVTPSVQKEIAKSVEILAGYLERSLVKRWLFLPGNNDLINENPETIGGYQFFVRALSARLGGNGMVIKDLSVRDGDPDSGQQDEPVNASSDNLVRFIGFNNASFKANGSREDALKFESYQSAEIKRIKQLIPGNDLNNYLGAYIFYHIPEIEDPYYDSLAVDDTNLLNYENGRGEFTNQYPRSAWTVTPRVRDEWTQVVTNDRVLGLFAGHFHSANRSVYEGFGWMLNPSVYTPSLHKLLIAPPVAIKKQQDKPVPTRGFREVNIGGNGKIFKTRLFFYDPPELTRKSNIPVNMESPVNWWIMPVYLVVTPVSVIIFLGVFFGVWYWLLRWSGIAVSGPSHNAIVLVTAALAAAVLGFVALGILTHCGGKDVCRVLGVGTLWALASLAVGGSLGILFGAPRSSGGKDGDGKEKAKTLLEEMADWLSKLIVGGSLFESSKILKFLDLAGRNFAATVSTPESILWSGVGSALLVYFSIVGFFGSYFLMRLYISRALDEADGRSEVSHRTGLPQTKLDALEGAPLSVEKCDDLGPVAKEAATEISAIPLESLTNWRDIRLWAKAKLSRNEIDAALEAYQKAIEIVPNDAETRLGYATALSQKGSSKELILQHLERAHDTLMQKSTKDLRKNVFKSLVYQCLYLRAPESFIKALQYSHEYFAGPDPVESGGLWINIACAYGQAYAWLAGSDQTMLIIKPIALRVNAAQPTLSEPALHAIAAPNQVTGTATDTVAEVIKSEREKQLIWLKQQALMAAKGALLRDPNWKEKLQELLNEGDKKSQDNDLASFQTDKDFRALAGLPISEPPRDMPMPPRVP